MSTLKERITEDMKSAMRAHETARLSTIRLLLAAMKQREVDERITLDDAAVVSVIEKMMKQRRDSIEQYGRGGRDDLVAAETAELQILEAYLPQGLTDADLENAVKTIISDRSLTSKKEVGAVMKELMVRYKGRVDGRRAQEIAQRLLP